MSFSKVLKISLPQSKSEDIYHVRLCVRTHDRIRDSFSNTSEPTARVSHRFIKPAQVAAPSLPLKLKESQTSRSKPPPRRELLSYSSRSRRLLAQSAKTEHRQHRRGG
ncbi:hypothetical protein EVAR_65649_1 [Eumeta japonica]|uniref:Uncharacterized protein n=1 Tax=Eumeta variegata TaxID=151549 RepID=A0A4C1Z453_EUMVA|nr:hypothetical protein EVAR_65649_1 [Eumeta japonica]